MPGGRRGVKYRELGGELPEDSLRLSKEPSEESILVFQKGNSSSEGYGDASGDVSGVTEWDDGGVTKWTCGATGSSYGGS